jgi:hypothetical protein
VILAGELPSLRIASLVGPLGLQYTRGARSHNHCHALGSIARARRTDRVVESILPQADLREAIVPAVELGEILTHRCALEAFDSTDVRVERHVLEVAPREARALGAQRGPPRVDA